MYCSSCGAAVPAGLSYCNRCGADLRSKESSVAKRREASPDSLVWGMNIDIIQLKESISGRTASGTNIRAR